MTGFLGRAKNKGVLAAAVVVGVVALMSATAARADVVTFHNASCTIGSTTQAVYLEAHPAQAFNPLHVVDPATGELIGILVPQTIYLDGTLIGTIAPGLEDSAVGLTTCMFLSSRGVFEVIGVLAPPTA
jgi:hypothetical protein